MALVTDNSAELAHCDSLISIERNSIYTIHFIWSTCIPVDNVKKHLRLGSSCPSGKIMISHENYELSVKFCCGKKRVSQGMWNLLPYDIVWQIQETVNMAALLFDCTVLLKACFQGDNTD